MSDKQELIDFYSELNAGGNLARRALCHIRAIGESMESLAQQLVAAETRATVNAQDCNETERQLAQMTYFRDNALKHVERLAGESFDANQELIKAQATITRLEAMATERDKEISEAVGLLKRIGGTLVMNYMVPQACNAKFCALVDEFKAYLSRHEGKSK